MPHTAKNQELISYQSNDGQISFNVNVFEETVWLTQRQMAELFDTTIQNIGQHIKSIFESEELCENRTIKKFFIVGQEGVRLVQREIEHYNLDMILSVGYRVQSKRATNFRIWATGILKQYLLSGYAINEKRIKALEEKIDNLSTEFKKEFKSEINQINKSLLKISNRPITINNQISIASNKLEEKAVELIGQIIKQIKNKELKNQLKEVQKNIKTLPKDKKAKNKVIEFLQTLVMKILIFTNQ